MAKDNNMKKYNNNDVELVKIFEDVNSKIFDLESKKIFEAEVKQFLSNKNIFYKKPSNSIYHITHRLYSKDPDYISRNRDQMDITVNNSSYDITIENCKKSSPMASIIKRSVSIQLNKETNSHKTIKIKITNREANKNIFAENDVENSEVVIEKLLDQNNNEINYCKVYMEESLNRCYIITVDCYEKEGNRYIICHYKNSHRDSYLIKKEKFNTKKLMLNEYADTAIKSSEHYGTFYNWIEMPNYKYKELIHSNKSIERIYNQEMNKNQKVLEKQLKNLDILS